MTLVLSVFLVAAGVVLWGLLSSWAPRFGVVANAAVFVFALKSVILGGFSMGLGWTVLCFVTVGFGMLAAIGGLIEQRRRAADARGLPRAQLL